jgi:hypothetical protein
MGTLQMVLLPFGLVSGGASIAALVKPSNSLLNVFGTWFGAVRWLAFTFVLFADIVPDGSYSFFRWERVMLLAYLSAVAGDTLSLLYLRANQTDTPPAKQRTIALAVQGVAAGLLLVSTGLLMFTKRH